MLTIFYITLMKKTNKYTRLSVACVFQKKLYSGEKKRGNESVTHCYYGEGTAWNSEKINHVKTSFYPDSVWKSPEWRDNSGLGVRNRITY
ncbi:hypothetical protein D3G96_25855 [Escherichia coli]|nr:hypothetical protein B2H83_27160 [Escherichia coli M8]EFN9660019.1 hypothetical protein [Escherichia coli]